MKATKDERTRINAEMRRCTEAMRGLLIGYKAQMEERLREQGLTLPQLRLLRTVQEHGGLSAAATARLCQVTPQTLQGILTRAVRDGWVVRGTSARNGRILTAALTEHGERTLALGMTMAVEIETVIWKDLSLGALKSTRRTLEQGLASLERAGEEKAVGEPVSRKAGGPGRAGPLKEAPAKSRDKTPKAHGVKAI